MCFFCFCFVFCANFGFLQTITFRGAITVLAGPCTPLPMPTSGPKSASFCICFFFTSVPFPALHPSARPFRGVLLLGVKYVFTYLDKLKDLLKRANVIFIRLALSIKLPSIPVSLSTTPACVGGTLITALSICVVAEDLYKQPLGIQTG